MSEKLGIYYVGALGGVATCAAVGLEAAKRGLAPPRGFVSELPAFRGLDLPALGGIEVGGCDIRKGNPYASAREFRRDTGILPGELLEALRKPLEAVGRRIDPGWTVNDAAAVRGMAADGCLLDGRGSLGRALEAVEGRLAGFQEATRADRVVVVNAASTEPVADSPASWDDPADFLRVFREDRRREMGSALLYATAAIRRGFPFVNFTPSIASEIPALEALAIERGVPHMGKDGKTGETLLKTVLAPMFAARNLKVLSWEGHNILGNRDGLVLQEPACKAAKERNKDRSLRAILPDGDLHSAVRIDYVPSLGDWKVAWDFIHFEGFLGARMKLQLLWEGADSMLAAPLTIDLARFAADAARRGLAGTLPHLACFFKTPIGVEEHDFFRQFRALLDYAAAPPTPPAARRAGRAAPARKGARERA